jgi:2-keto-4-pentenoate hydratase/2-oxohepta-3-ene-1,7-dioic acid hydratase in catechol pathway
MRLATVRDAQGARLGVVRDGTIIDLARVADAAAAPRAAGGSSEILHDMLALIAGGDAALARVRALVDAAPGEATYDLAQVELLAPIPRPRKNIFCLGRNYAEHAAESLRAIGKEVQLPTSPNVFTKAPTTVSGPNADIPYDASVSERVDWEVELGVIIGVGGRHIPKERALQAVWGYTVLNDVSARDLQNRPGVQWFLGKSVDGSCPMGPVIVTADEIPDPQALRLELRVNGVVKQDDTTAHMLFDVATIIEALSHVLTLEPGDVIATGTPAGVGFARTPPEFLHPGDLMESSIERIGTLRNRVVDVSGARV